VNRDQWARTVLIHAWRDFGAPSPGMLQAVQAIARHESGAGYGDGMGGANNWGSIHCVSGPPCGDDCVEHTDTNAKGEPYTTCFRRYATPEAGARDLIRELLRRPAVRAVLGTGEPVAIATAMRATGYFEAPIATYAAAILRNAKAIAKATGEPLLMGHGPDELAGLALLAGVAYFMHHWRPRPRRRKG
jgi:hypothetical protein